MTLPATISTTAVAAAATVCLSKLSLSLTKRVTAMSTTAMSSYHYDDHLGDVGNVSTEL